MDQFFYEWDDYFKVWVVYERSNEDDVEDIPFAECLTKREAATVTETCQRAYDHAQRRNDG